MRRYGFDSDPTRIQLRASSLTGYGTTASLQADVRRSDVAAKLPHAEHRDVESHELSRRLQRGDPCRVRSLPAPTSPPKRRTPADRGCRRPRTRTVTTLHAMSRMRAGPSPV